MSQVFMFHIDLTLSVAMVTEKDRQYMTDFSDQFRKIIMRYKRSGYNLHVM